MRKRLRAHGPYGPVYFYPEGEGAAGGDAGAGTGGGGGTPPPPAAGNGAAGAPAPAAGTQQPPSAGDQAVPYARFKEVNDELQARRKADEEREAEEAKKKGEYEKLAESEKTKRETAELRALRAERRLAFVTAAGSKVSDVNAAYKLAAADGILDSIDLDDDGNVKDPDAVGKAIDGLVKTYAFLKPGAPTTGRDFGQPAGDALPPGTDVSKLSPMEKMRIGIQQSSRK
jgi:hypothetical protein